MKTVRELLRSKPIQTVYFVSPSTPVTEAVKLMAARNIGALVVMDEGHIAGVVSERDYVRKLAAEGLEADHVAVREIMTSPVMYVEPGQTNEECMALMTDNRLRHLPVVERGRLLGLISIGDLVKDIISEQQFVIEQLEHYITGRAM